MKSISFLSAILIVFTLFSCSKEQSATKQITTDTAMLNLSYGADKTQIFDAFLPANRSTESTKVIILIHGGSWVAGDKSDLTAIVGILKIRFPKYAIFNINYRWSDYPSNIFPTQENDVNTAINFIYNNAKTKYFISNKYAFVGISAGAHLAMLQGFKNNSMVMPKAIASFSGPSDLIDMYNNPVAGNQLISEGIAYAVGNTPLTNTIIYNTSSPINYINKTSPPTILFQGGEDPYVSVTQATKVQSKLVNAGVVNQYVFYPNQGHIDTWDNPTILDALNKLQVFINTNVL